MYLNLKLSKNEKKKNKTIAKNNPRRTNMFLYATSRVWFFFQKYMRKIKIKFFKVKKILVFYTFQWNKNPRNIFPGVKMRSQKKNRYIGVIYEVLYDIGFIKIMRYD